jgi:hypothetical protein
MHRTYVSKPILCRGCTATLRIKVYEIEVRVSECVQIGNYLSLTTPTLTRCLTLTNCIDRVSQSLID